MPASIHRITCDHLDDAQTAAVFEQLPGEGLDVLVNSCWGGYERMIEDGQFTWPRRQGLIVNISHWAAQKHIGNAIYGISKAATDKMTADMAHELRPHGIAAVSLYSGLVRTEAVLQASKEGWFDLANSESPEFTGRVVAALWRDPRLMARSGQALVAAALALELGVCDIDSKQPVPLTLETV